MSRVEAFKKMMRREGADRLFLDIWTTEPFLDKLEKHRGTRDVRKAYDIDFDTVYPDYTHDASDWKAAYEAIGFHVPDNATIGLFGFTNLTPSLETLGDAYHLREMAHPVAVVSEVTQLEALPWPDVDSPKVYEKLKSQVEAIHAEDRVAVGSMACTVFESAWYLRGMDNLFIDLAENNPVGFWILDWFTHRSIQAVRAYGKAGCDVILLGDDIGTQRGMLMGLDLWRNHFKPRLKAVVDEARASATQAAVFYHSDGNVSDVLPELIETGIDILNPVQPECMSLDDVAGKWGRHIGFWGMIGTQTTMPFGTPDDVKREVENCAKWARQGVPIVVAPTHVIEPDVPIENVEALVEAVRAF